jgi:phospholipid-binding lipoprotein MlaA
MPQYRPLLLKTASKSIAMVMCAFLLAATTGCTSARSELQPNAVYDPLEPLNRGVFAFNNALDRALLEPAAKVYNFLTPDFFRAGVQNFMRNLRSPLIVANNVLQGDFKGAGVATARFVMNTVGGIGGLFDMAGANGLPYEPEDFGQTLAVWGFGEGFYLVLPVLGPSSLRDTAGLAVDTYADPVRLYAFNRDEEWIYYTRGAVEGLDNRARLVSAVRDMRRNSLDYYAAVRSAYTQKRRSLVRDINPDAPAKPQAVQYYDEGWE